MLIINTTGKAKRLEDGVGVFSDIAPYVIGQALGNAAGLRIDDDSRAAEVVTDDLGRCCHL